MKAFFKGRVVFLCVVVSFFLVALMAGCASMSVKETEQSSEMQAPQENRITDVQLQETADKAHVLVTGDQKLIFTAVKQPAPPAVIFYFPETGVGIDAPIETVPGNFITDVGLTELTETGHTARLEIKLAANAAYDVEHGEKGLDIVIHKSGAVKVEDIKEDIKEVPSAKGEEKQVEKPFEAAVNVKPASKLIGIETKPSANGLQIRVGLDGVVGEYKSFTLEQPPRIVFDFPKLKTIFQTEQKVDVKDPIVRKIRHYGDGNKLRVVIDTKKKYLDSFYAVPDDDSLLITVGTSAADAEQAQVNGIKYHSDAAGKSQVLVSTSRNVQYKIKRISPRLLRLFLLNCQLPEGGLPATDTSDQNGAVTNIVPVAGAGQSGKTQVDIRLRETVPYLVKQDDGRLYVLFEALDAGSMAKKGVATKSRVTIPAIENEGGSDEKVGVEPTAKKGPKYSGEKIALDFYNTDIHNVFRILADISGQNFAIDKDVEGKVTLSLDNPVPWDQVLDLVLKMNQLDKRWDNNIIRIATLKTLSAEDAAHVAQLKAKRDQEEQADVLTEYILINYADATKDVKPHIDNILSKNGKLSVDTRSNLLILTDVPTVIARAKEIVKEIDNATPQVLIEARIVEADNSFSREFGLSWNAAWGIQSSDPRAGIGPQRGFDRFGGTYGWDTATNFPFASGNPMEVGFNIAKVAGTPFSLDARLRLLEINGNGRVVSAPKVLTLDSQEAVITQGQEYPYFEESESGGRTVKFKKVELKLTVTPHITPDGRIAIHLKIEKKDVFNFVENVPILNTKEAETEFLMNDRDTLVIGGIHKTTERLSESGYPWLSKIPFLGWLFKTSAKELDKEELLIFISPKIRQLEHRGVKSTPGSMG